MITDITGIQLTPSNGGVDCLGNGEHFDTNGNLIECCCDECDYMKCCFVMTEFEKCARCNDEFCPHSLRKK